MQLIGCRSARVCRRNRIVNVKTICSAHRFSDILKNTEKCLEISATTKTKSRLMMLKQTSCRDLPIGPTGHVVVGEFTNWRPGSFFSEMRLAWCCRPAGIRWQWKLFYISIGVFKGKKKTDCVLRWCGDVDGVTRCTSSITCRS